MSTIGVIFCSWQTADLTPRAIAAWLEARQTQMSGHRFLICGVSCPFQGFDSGEPDGTLALMQGYREAGQIDHLVTSDTPLKETEARGRALQWLVAAGADTIWQADSDELITEQQITRIAAFWTARPHVCWARLSLKNRVFTRDQYLVEPFTPPRLHRVHSPGNPYRAHSFHQDNNVTYGGALTRDLVPDERFSSVVIPPNVAHIDHLTWLNDGSSGRSRRKIAYQVSRWGAQCTFDWDESRGGLIFRDGLPPPEVARDE